MEGRRLIILMIVGGMTQYYTMAQGMPKQVENTLRVIIRNYIWNSTTRSPPRADDTMFLPYAKGGRKLLDIKSRNEAINLMKLKRLLNFSETRPLCADATQALLMNAIPAGEQMKYHENARVDIFLQSIFNRSTYARNPKIPRDLKAVMQAYIDYRVTFYALRFPNGHLRKLPAWNHIGHDPQSKITLRENSPAGKCLRVIHNISKIEDLMAFVGNIENEEHVHDTLRICECAVCANLREIGCSNIDNCLSLAQKLLNRLAEKFDPYEDYEPRPWIPHGLELATPINHAIETRGGISNNFRVFVDTKIQSLELPKRNIQSNPTNDNIQVIYTDGSCINNGDHNASAGAGVWYDTNSNNNLSLKVPNDKPQSNNYAEIFAIYAALKNAPKNTPVLIRSDSY